MGIYLKRKNEMFAFDVTQWECTLKLEIEFLYLSSFFLVKNRFINLYYFLDIRVGIN
jgi:hypothetical protein